MSVRERIEWMLRVSLLVFILGATAFLSAVMAMRFAIQGREVDMPNLIGKSLPDVEAIVHGRRLQLKIVDRIYSDLPANTVARQSPPAGEQMKISQDAHVVLSLGPQNVIVPQLAGQSLRIARIQLLQSGLQLGEVTSYSGPNTAVDTVLQQNPAAGARATSLSVDLLVAEGAPEPAYVMPSLTGMLQSDAERLAISSGLKIPKITSVISPQLTKGTVIQQSPEAGSKVTADSPIELSVAQ